MIVSKIITGGEYDRLEALRKADVEFGFNIDSLEKIHRGFNKGSWAIVISSDDDYTEITFKHIMRPISRLDNDIHDAKQSIRDFSMQSDSEMVRYWKDQLITLEKQLEILEKL